MWRKADKLGEDIAMEAEVRELTEQDLPEAVRIWNSVVRAGEAFPQTELLDERTGREFFGLQTYTGVAVDRTGTVAGMYILHPNNVGRCGHICNASYAVKEDMRGLHVGERLVRHCMATARELGFGILQFNAVVKDNVPALALYKKLGFVQLGVIPGGFLKNDGTYEDIIPHYIRL